MPDGLDAFEYVWANLEAERLKRELEASRIGLAWAFPSLLSTVSADGLRRSRCAHADAVPVESVVTGELLARLCPDCDQQLSTDYSR